MALEIEVKLAVKGDYAAPILERLQACLAEQALEACFNQKELVNHYFDTPKFDLNQQKMALRVREKTDKNGQPVYIQTLKTAGVSVDGLSQRGEWEWMVPDSKLDFQALLELKAWPSSINVEALVSVFDTNFTRYQTEFSWQGSMVEVVLDWGWVQSNGQQERIHEIELELKRGEQAALLSLSKFLQTNLPLKPSDISKAERGFRLFKHN